MDRILCFETGGTKLVTAVADRDGRLLRRQVEYRQEGQRADRTVERLCRMGHSILEGDRPLVVSWGFGGTVDRSGPRPADCFHEEGWEDMDAVQCLHREFQAPVLVENDCNFAALAEAMAVTTPASEDQTLLYVTVGTGIGGGFIRHRKILELSPVGEMEIGHMIVRPDGPPCGCGNRGCLESLCSGPGLAELNQRMTARTQSTETLMQEFRAGEPVSSEVVELAAGYMGKALAAAVNLLLPDRVVLGGGVMQGNADYLEQIRQATVSRVFPVFRRRMPRFELSRLQKDVVCQGAAWYGRQQLAALERPS